MNNIILELKNLRISFDNKKTYILKDISFWVNKWEILSIIWLNWTWKTTLLKTIAWIYDFYTWKIIRNYKCLSYVPQKIDIDKTFPVNVIEFIKIFNKDFNYEETIKYFKRFNSEYLINKNISNLSWGELQKVLIISALISKPEILLLDEPTAWIDIIWEELFYEIVSEIKEVFPDISIILVSHNINLVYKKADKVICLHENNFCCHWTPKELSNNIEVKKIFWEYVLPYEHNPHKNHNH